jgi:hypothetical protein
MEDHVVAETGQLVGVTPALEQHLDPADRRQPPRQGQEERGIDDQLLFAGDLAPHPPRQLGRHIARDQRMIACALARPGALHMHDTTVE